MVNNQRSCGAKITGFGSLGSEAGSVCLAPPTTRVIQNLTEDREPTSPLPLVFKVGDHVYLKVSPWKGVQRFGIKGKLAPRYIGPYPIVERCGPVAYRLDLPANLSAVHNIFHVSQLRKCHRVPTEVIESDLIQLESDLTYSEHPIKIIDRKDRVTRRTTNRFYKGQWSNHSEDEATWEKEDF